MQKKGFTLIECLTAVSTLIDCLIAVVAIAFVLVLLFPHIGTLAEKNSSKETVGVVEGISVLSEFTYQGCQYIRFYYGVTHKGNCTNVIHSYNK